MPELEQSPSRRVLPPKEERLKNAILEIEKAKLPSQKEYISITPRQLSLLYSQLVKEEEEFKQDFSEEDFKKNEITNEELRDFLERSNIKVEASIEEPKPAVETTHTVLRPNEQEVKPRSFGVPVPTTEPVRPYVEPADPPKLTHDENGHLMVDPNGGM